MQVLDKGEINLINFVGGDEAVVASARVSNGILYQDASKGEEKDAKLIKYLLLHQHMTPFEHSLFTFYVKCPIFVAREWMRHRSGSFNEISGRYVEFEPEFYIPKIYRTSAPTNKQGSVTPTEPVNGLDLEDWHDYNRRVIHEVVTYNFSHYKWLLSQGVAKEMARMILPLSLYTQFYWTVNARNLMHFIELRQAEDAQFEIREYAKAALSIFSEKMPVTAGIFLSRFR